MCCEQRTIGALCAQWLKRCVLRFLLRDGSTSVMINLPSCAELVRPVTTSTPVTQKVPVLISGGFHRLQELSCVTVAVKCSNPQNHAFELAAHLAFGIGRDAMTWTSFGWMLQELRHVQLNTMKVVSLHGRGLIRVAIDRILINNLIHSITISMRLLYWVPEHWSAIVAVNSWVSNFRA